MTFPAARFTAWLAPCLLALDLTAARATTPAFEIALDDGYCGLAVGHDVVPPADTIPQALNRLDDTGDGRKTFDYGCTLADSFVWGTAESPQTFLGMSTVHGAGELGFGQLRLTATASALVDPARYLLPAAIGGVNPYSAIAEHFATVSFIDVFTPPPTSGAPAAHNPTTLRFQLHLACDETGDSTPVTSMFAAFYTPAVFDLGHTGRLTPFDTFLFRSEGMLGHVPCAADAVKTIAAKVGEPVVVWAGMTVIAGARRADDTSPGPHFSMSRTLDATTVFATDSDGRPLVGASGHTYTPGVVLPTVTTTTSTSTTTTLPTVPGTCGDGALQAGEQCDCPATSDPVVQAAGCTGASVLPAQAACVICRQCALLANLCAPTTTTTTSVTTTTLASTTTLPDGTTTTTTTLPDIPACAGKVGIAHALCRLDGALRAPLCGSETVPPGVDGALRTKLTRARDLLEIAGTRSGKKLARVLRRSRRALTATANRARRAAAATRPAKHVSAECAAALTSLAGDTKADLQTP